MLGELGKLVGHTLLQLGHRAGYLNASGTSANNDNSECFLRQVADFHFFIGLQQAAANNACLGDRLHLQRIFGNARHTEGGAYAASRENKIVEVNDISVVHAQALGFSVDAHNLAALEGNTGNRCANGVGDVVFGQASSRDLVEQWREELVRVAVDDRDVDALGIGELTSAAKAAEPGAHDDDVTIAHADQPLFDARR